MLEEKLDLLTKELVALRKAVEENTAAGGATASGKSTSSDSGDAPAPKTGRGRGRPAKEEAPAPEHTADEVEEKIRAVSREVGKPVAKKIITGFKCEDLADLLTHPEHFDAAYEKAEAALAESGGDDAEDDI